MWQYPDVPRRRPKLTGIARETVSQNAKNVFLPAQLAHAEYANSPREACPLAKYQFPEQCYKMHPDLPKFDPNHNYLPPTAVPARLAHKNQEGFGDVIRELREKPAVPIYNGPYKTIEPLDPKFRPEPQKPLEPKQIADHRCYAPVSIENPSKNQCWSMCRYNASHLYRYPEIERHERECPDREIFFR